MGLLSPSDFAEIRAAVRSVTDTFYVTPILYKKSIDSLDVYQEKRTKQYEEINFNGFVEYPQDKGSTNLEKADVDGSISILDVKVTLNINNVRSAGLLDSDNKFTSVPENDRLQINGITYVPAFAGMAAPLDADNLLFIITAKELIA